MTALDEMSDQDFLIAYFIHTDALSYGEDDVFTRAQGEEFDYDHELNRRFLSEQLDALAEWATNNHCSTTDLITAARSDYDTIVYAMTPGV